MQKAYALDVITFERASLTVEAGTTVTLSPTLHESTILAVFVWYKDGNLLVGVNNDTLTLNNVQPSDAGVYRVTYVSALGALLGSASITLNVGETITLSDQTVTEGQEISIVSSIVASAIDPSFSWSKDGSPLPSVTGSSFTKASAEASDSGTYEVIYFDGEQEIGRASTTLTIAAPVPPQLTGGDTVSADATLTSQIANGIDLLNGAGFSLDTDITLPSGALLSIAANGSFTYNPNGQFDHLYDGESETDSFTLANVAGSTTITLTINGVGEPIIPPQITGSATVAVNAILNSQIDNGIDLLNGVTLVTDTDITLPSGAIVNISASGALTYNPNGVYDHLTNGQSETDSFTVANAAGSTTITITLNGAGEPEETDPPQVTGDTTVAADSTLTLEISNSVDEVNGAPFTHNADIALPSGATVNITATGTLTYDPNGAFDTVPNGDSTTDSFTLGNSIGTTNVTLTIDGTAEPAETNPPQITGDTTVTADSTLTLEISNSVDEVNGAPFTHNSDIALPSGATVNITATGTLTYDPNGAFDALPEGDTTTDSFALGNSIGTTNVTLTIDGTAEPAETDPPQVTGDTTVAADSTLTLEISNSVDEVNGAPFTHNSDIALPSGATVNITATGTLTYDPNGAFDTLPQGDSTTDSFSLGNSVGTTNVTVTIDGTAEPAETDPPQVTGDTTVAADSTLTLEISNSVDEVNGATFTHNTDIALPSGATVNITATGTLTYDPNGAFDTLPEGDSTTDSFTLGNSVGTTNVTVTIDGTAEPAETNPPQVIGDTTVAADSTLTLEISNSVDEVNGATFTHNSDIALPSGATVNITATGTLTYDPNGAFDTLPNGDSTTDSFTLGNSVGTTNVTLTINGAEEEEPAETNPPQVTGDTTVAADSTLTLEISNSVDEVNGATFTHNSDIALPSGATVNITATGTLTYDPNGAFDTLPNGDSTTDSFTLGNSVGTTNVTVTIDGTAESAETDPPQVTGDTTVAADSTLTLEISNSVDEVNGAPFTHNSDIALPSGATVNITATGTLTYDPNGAFDTLPNGDSTTDSFALGNSVGTTNVTLTIDGTAEPAETNPPQITGDTTVAADSTLTLEISNSVDEVNGAPFTHNSDIALPSGATVNITATGTLTYDPNGAFDTLPEGDSTTDSFALGNSIGTTNVTLTIDGTAEPAETNPPQITGDTTVAADSTLTLEIGNSVDEVNGASFTHNSDIALPSGATVNITATGTLTYDPNGAFDALPEGDTTTDSFSLGNAIGTTNVTLTINGAEEEEPAETDPPQVTGGTTVAADSTLTLEISNSVDEVNGAPFTHNADIALPSGATVNITATGTLTYDPNGAFDTLPEGDSTTDSFTLGNSVGTTNVTVTIDGTAEPAETNPPQVTGDTTVAADSTLTLEISNSVDEVNGAPFTHDADIALPSGATVNITATGTLTYDPNGAFDTLPEGDSTTDSFALGNSIGTTNVTLTIDGADDGEPEGPPQLTGGNTVAADGILNGQIANGVDELNGATFAKDTDIALPSGALISIADTGAFTYNPNGQFNHLSNDETATESFSLGNERGTSNINLTINGAGVDEQEAATILAAKQEKIEETQRTISTYTARRANQITSNSPELTVRLNADYITNPGTPAQFFATGSIANYQMKFSTSLRQMLHANEHRKAKQRMALASNGLEPLSLADDISNTGFDIWVRGQWSDVRTDTSESELGLLQIGMDYRFNENLVVGFLTRFDWTDEVNKSIDQDLNGAGWLAGPYMVTRLHKNLMFDASASWGQSDNKTKTGGNPAENYETDRMLLTGRLTGDFDFHNINFRPHIGVIYYQENIKGYTDNDDNYIPGQTVELGRFTFGPKVTLKFEQDDGTVIAPYVATRGIWDFLKEDKIDSQTGFAVSSDNLRARVDAGLNIRLPSGIKINGEGFYDGIGADDYQAIGGNIKVNVPLN